MTELTVSTTKKRFKCSRCYNDIDVEDPKVSFWILAKIEDDGMLALIYWCDTCARLDFHIIESANQERVMELAKHILEDAKNERKISEVHK